MASTWRGEDPSNSSASTSTVYLYPSPPTEKQPLPLPSDHANGDHDSLARHGIQEDEKAGYEVDHEDEEEEEDPVFDGLLSDPPTWGPDFYHLRRSLFLSGRLHPSQTPVPHPSRPPSVLTSTTSALPTPPSPATVLRNSRNQPASSLERLELLLSAPGAEETQEAWTKGGVENIHRYLVDGRRLAKGMRLGLVIKILRAGWIKDGTWPPTPASGTSSLASDPFFDSPPSSPAPTYRPDLARSHSVGSSAVTERAGRRRG